MEGFNGVGLALFVPLFNQLSYKMMYLPAELLEYAIAIEATATITYGVIKGGIEVRDLQPSQQP